MIIGVPKEIMANERRVAAIPETVSKLKAMGFTVLVEKGAGEGSFFSDADYAAAGAEMVADVASLFDRSDVVLKVKQPCNNAQTGKNEAEMMRQGATLITFLHPATPSHHAFVKTLAERRVTSFTMDGIPRISKAQKMDALTSMSTITGYKAVLMAANHLPKFVPMVGTAIGAVKPCKFLVIGAGVVGLQAIATAKRLGAVVTAVDIRPQAREEAKSLGAKVEGFEVPEDLAIGKGGYAQALPADWIEKERAALAPLVADADAVILSALVPGEIAPVVVTESMVATMRPGSVIVDISIDQGGNCGCTQPGKEALCHDVMVSGVQNIPGRVPVHASWLYANNMLHYVENLYKKGLATPDFDDEIARSSLVTRDGKILHQGYLKAVGELH